MIISDFRTPDGQWATCLPKNGTSQRALTRSWVYYSNMRNRCLLGGASQTKRPAYVGTICDFIDFQSFAEWCQHQVGYNVAGFHLDKDLLVKGNKRYSADTCVFIPAQINSLICRQRKNRGVLPPGVSWNGKVYVAQCHNGGKSRFAGHFSSPADAFYAYKLAKEHRAKAIAEIWRSQIDYRAYEALINYTVEITD